MGWVVGREHIPLVSVSVLGTPLSRWLRSHCGRPQNLVQLSPGDETKHRRNREDRQIKRASFFDEYGMGWRRREIKSMDSGCARAALERSEVAIELVFHGGTSEAKPSLTKRPPARRAAPGKHYNKHSDSAANI